MSSSGFFAPMWTPPICESAELTQWSIWIRLSLKQTNKISVRTKTNRNKICFGCVSICFVKLKTKNFGFFRCFEQSRNNWNKQNCFEQTETTINFLKNTKMCSLSNCSGWSSVCFGSIETSQLSVSRNNRNKLFRNKPKQTETNRKIPTFSRKNPKYASYQTLSVGLLFVSVQSKHRNSLFRYRNETTETNFLFWIVPKLVSVQLFRIKISFKGHLTLDQSLL